MPRSVPGASLDWSPMAVLSAARTVPRGARNYLRELWARREFAWYMAMGRIKARNASTALGLLWWVLNPLLLGLVYFVVFGLILGVSRDLSYLLSGMFVFYYTSTAMTGGANAVISNSKLLVNLRFPRLILPFEAMIEAGVGFLASVVAFYAIVGPAEGVLPPKRIVVLLPAAFLLHSIFNFGLATATARIAVPFRDVNNFIPYLLRLWLYLSPIIYSLEYLEKRLSPEMLRFFHLNPLVPFLSLYRSALLGYRFRPDDLLSAALWAVGVTVVAVAAFVRYEGKMARYL